MLDLMESADFSICDVGPRYADIVKNHKQRNLDPASQKKPNGESCPAEPNPADVRKKSLEARAKAHLAGSAIAFNLECFGDELARRMNYREHVGMDAIHFYLVEKHHWLPSQVKSMHPNELWWLLREEKSGWVTPGLSKASETGTPKA